jgi:hypothetical protein
MSKADAIKIELRLHETLFFIGILSAILLTIWIVGHLESAPIGWLFTAALLTSVASIFSVWNYRYFRRLLKELENCDI